MDILLLLVPLSIILVAVIAVFLFWAIESGQFDQLDSPGHQVLLDSDSVVSSVISAVKSHDEGHRIS